MRDYIEKLAKGNIEYEKPEIRISKSSIEVVINTGADYTGTFTIESFDQEFIYGKIYSSNPRMKVENPFFSGHKATIHYHFNGKGLIEEEKLKGNFYIVGNSGEMQIPFQVFVENCFLDTSLGKIKNLFHFANLASSHWQEAFSLFKTRDFKKILKNNDRQYIPVYKGLTKDSIRERDLEEFLITAKKKNLVHFEIHKSCNLVDNFTSSLRSTVVITKSNWGYVELQAYSDAPFIRLEKEHITMEDFLGKKCELGYIIDENYIHLGTNYGKIYIKSPYETLTFEIIVKTEKNKEISSVKEEKVLRHKLLNLYLDFRHGKMDTSAWIKESVIYLDRLEKIDPFSVLYRAQILIGGNDIEGAWQILSKFKKEYDVSSLKAEIAGYFTYLSVFINQEEEELKKATLQVQNLYKKQNDNWKLLWLLLYLDKNLEGKNRKKLELIENSFYKKGNSPIMYLEAYRILKEDPSLLTKLGKFEIQVCWWICKKKNLTPALAGQIASLAGGLKTFHPLVYKILENCYDTYNEKDTVKMICSYLIKGNQVKEQYFKWFKLGITLDLNITKLYEYYMDSLNTHYNGTLPHRLLMYFSYNNQLDYRKKAFLYVNVIKNKEVEPIIYRNYLKQIDKFVYEQIKLGHMNEDLGFLYKEMLVPEQMTEEIAGCVARVLYTYRFSCSNADIKSVTVIHRQFSKEEKVPCIDGTAFIHIYTNDNVIVLQDNEENSYVGTVPYTITPLLEHSVFESRCIEMKVDFVPLLVHHYENQIQNQENEEICNDLMARIMESPFIHERYRQELLWKKIEALYDENHVNKINTYWEKLNFKYLQPYEVGHAIEILIFLKKNKEAYEMIEQYGPEKTSLKMLVKLCSRIMWGIEQEYEASLVDLSYYVFSKGKYNDWILEYLVEYLEGNLEDLISLWSTVNAFEVEHDTLTERIISQSLYVKRLHRDHNEVFREYFESGMRNNLVIAYLTKYAHNYLIKEETIPEAIIEYISEIMLSDDELNDLCRLAFLKYHASKKKTDEKYCLLIKETLEEYCRRNMRFEFFQRFDRKCLPDFYIPISSFAEYRTNPENRVYIHYLLENEKGEPEDYHTEEMKNLCYGIFVKEFTLFYGEHLQYYITDESPEGEQITQSSQISFKDINMGNGQGRFELLNDILFSKHINDDSTLFELVNQYEEKSFIINKGLKIR